MLLDHLYSTVRTIKNKLTPTGIKHFKPQPQHTPLNIDEKNVEFEIADFGMIGLQTAFGLLNKKLENEISKEKLIELLSTNPRKIINQKNQINHTNHSSDFIILNFDEEYIYTEKNNLSKSKNSPYFNQTLKGKVKAVFAKGKLMVYVV